MNDFDFDYPNELIALEPARPSRVCWSAPGHDPEEIGLDGLLSRFVPGDLLVINDSKVIPARVFTPSGLDILFLSSADRIHWDVLFSCRGSKLGARFELPGGVTATLEQHGLPQKLTTDQPLDVEFFNRFGELAIPPYIQEMRGERRNRANESQWYQTKWAEKIGSVAAPTASLHFSTEHLSQLQARGVNVGRVTLHVGAGTFMPIRNTPEDHQMHAEHVEIPLATVDLLERTRGRVWALGTTAARSLEALKAGHFERRGDVYSGDTKLFIYPPYEFQAVDGLLTNFHQPRSTLLCLVAAFAGLDRMKATYKWAVEQKFRLFSYGDLSVWTK